MTIDVHAKCQTALNQFNTARMAREAQVPSYESALKEFKSDMKDVFEVCELIDIIGQDGVEILKQLYEEPLYDTLTTPKFYGDLLDTISGSLIFSPFCLVEIAGALQSESTFRMKEQELAKLEAEEEKARVNYINCLRDAGFQKSRREGNL